MSSKSLPSLPPRKVGEIVTTTAGAKYAVTAILETYTEDLDGPYLTYDIICSELKNRPEN